MGTNKPNQVKAFFIALLKPLAMAARPYVKAYINEKIVPVIQAEVDTLLAAAKAKQDSLDNLAASLVAKVEDVVMQKINQL